MSSTIAQWINILGDPHLTAQFQRKCGIRSSAIIKDSNGVQGNVVANNYVPTNGNVSSTANGKLEKSVSRATDLNISKNNLKERKNVNTKETNSFQINGDVDVLNLQNNNDVHDDSDQRKTGLLHHSIDNKFLYWFFSFGASLGNSTFYTLFFSASVWSFDSYVLRKTLLLWIVDMYVGQVAKDIIRWPRPKSPPVVRLEERYELEYGMPSTHAMVGFVLPFGMLYFMAGRYEFSLPLGLLVAVAWCSLVCFSRIYLGMHSVLDVIAGVLFSAFLMLVTLPFVDPVDRFIISHALSMPVVVAACVLLGLIYPRVEKWSTTRADTMLSLGVFSGIYEGLWLVGRLTDFKPAPEVLPLALSLPSPGTIGLAVTRQLLGVPIICITAVVTKLCILHVLSWCYKYNPNDPETKRRLEIPYRFGAFFVASSVGIYLMLIISCKMNIERPGLFVETFSYMA